MTGAERILPLHDYTLRGIKTNQLSPAALDLICNRCGLQLAQWPAGSATVQTVVHTIRLHEDNAHETGQAAVYDRAGWDPRRSRERERGNNG